MFKIITSWQHFCIFLKIKIFLSNFLTVFILAKTKVIFINEWFVDKNNSTIGVDISSYQADYKMQLACKQCLLVQERLFSRNDGAACSAKTLVGDGSPNP